LVTREDRNKIGEQRLSMKFLSFGKIVAKQTTTRTKNNPLHHHAFLIDFQPLQIGSQFIATLVNAEGEDKGKVLTRVTK